MCCLLVALALHTTLVDFCRKVLAHLVKRCACHRRGIIDMPPLNSLIHSSITRFPIRI